MVCGGFTCSKNALCSLNVVYMLVGLLLIGVAAWGKGFGLVSSIHIIGGVIAVGVFLLLIAIVGLIGAIHHHQVMLFFYMVVLFIVFLFQFGVSCSCLAMNRGQQEALLNSAWGMLENKTKTDLESQLNCCGLLNVTASQAQFDLDLQNCPAVGLRYQHCSYEKSCFNCTNTVLSHYIIKRDLCFRFALYMVFLKYKFTCIINKYCHFNKKIPVAQHAPLNRSRSHKRFPLNHMFFSVVLRIDFGR
ncbi:tetraspanin-31 isoform X1 [Pseudoliparis swirei]|uniref:tetraspanin-31 isoform X1 n=1 Tax=Pseudoliparis swirei TaxID=2059687 RepID=UPI0024BEA95B|nr:tetraspanin-31 isoform X1 [Pseudoliparis swirei]